MANSFINLGVKEKEIVDINIRNYPEWLYACFGAVMAGAIPISVSFTYVDGSDLVAMMEKIRTCSLLVMDPGLLNVNWNIVRQLVDNFSADGTVRSEKMPYLRYLVDVAFDQVEEQLLKFSDLLQTNLDITLPHISTNDTVFLFQTSGSTGVPKVVAHIHEVFLKGITGKLIDHMDPKYKLFNDRPFAWLGGYPLSVITGQTRVTISGFCEPPEDRVSFMIDVIEKEKCSAIFALPPLMHERIKRQVIFKLYHIPAKFINVNKP